MTHYLVGDTAYPESNPPAVKNGIPVVLLDLDAVRGCWAETRDPAAIVQQLRGTNSVAALAIADQIEAQTAPPKPPEPTGLGAVVEDARGLRWVRDVIADRPAVWWCATPGREMRGQWRDVDAVRVLSEGVPS